MSFFGLVARLQLVFVVLICATGCSPDPASTHLNRANELLRQKKIAAARREIDAALELKPADLDVYLQAMDIYHAAGRFGDEAEVGEMLAERSRRSVLAKRLSASQRAALYAAIGNAHWQARNTKAAEEAYLSALKLAPNNGILMNDLGYFYAEQGIKLPTALELTRKAVKLNPDSGTVLDSLGWVQYKMRDYDAAVATLEKAVKLEPNQAELRYHLGAAYAKAGRPVRSRVELKKALVLDNSIQDTERLFPRGRHVTQLSRWPHT